MGSRAQLIMNLALQNQNNVRGAGDEQGNDAIPHNFVQAKSTNLTSTNSSTVETSLSSKAANFEATTSFEVSSSEPTKVLLRRVSARTYNESDDSDKENWGETSDEYNPSDAKSESNSDESFIQSAIDSTPVSSPQPTPLKSPQPKQVKKRVRNPENWKNAKKRLLKNSGRSYLSKTGKAVDDRKIKPPCTSKCKLSCTTKFSESARGEIFKRYWQLASLQRQRDFLGSCIEPIQVKYRRIYSSGEPRKPNCAFFLQNEGRRIRVCKTFLINTVGIAERTIRTVIQSRVSDSGIAAEDKRGKHGHHAKLNDELLNSVRAHINSVPRIESHYLRANTSREFIDGGLCIAEMHRHYKSDRDNDNKPAAKYDTYARIFNTEFNIGFFAPKKDQCDLCESYQNAVGSDKEKLEDTYNLHQKEKELSRIERSRDKEIVKGANSNTVLAVYDLQAVLPVPSGQTSAFFYSSRLNCFNFTISEIANDRTVCYFWHEGLGNRGATEIGSCVLMFLAELSSNRPNCDVIFYSDNCGGQQKNRFLLGMYLYAVEKYAFNSITHKYLIRGHTQNEGDAVHSIIEKSVKKAKKSGSIYVPDQYVSIIRQAKKTGNSLEVKEVSFGDFTDLKLLTDEIGLNHSTTVDGNNVKISELKMVRFVKGSEVYFFKTSYSQKEWTEAYVQTKKRRSGHKVISTVTTKPAYKTKIAISETKKTALASLLEKNIIKKYYAPFYTGLFEPPTA